MLMTNRTYSLQVEQNPDHWITLRKYCGLSEVKANFYVNLCNFGKNYVPNYKNVRMVNDL